MMSLISVRERGGSWRSAPSPALAAGLAGEGLAAVAVASFGVPGLPALPSGVVGFVAAAAVACLGVNHGLKRVLISRIFAGQG